jgi:hypothetical protein
VAVVEDGFANGVKEFVSADADDDLSAASARRTEEGLRGQALLHLQGHPGKHGLRLPSWA